MRRQARFCCHAEPAAVPLVRARASGGSVLARFYRLPEPTIRRFYALALDAWIAPASSSGDRRAASLRARLGRGRGRSGGIEAALLEAGSSGAAARAASAATSRAPRDPDRPGRAVGARAARPGARVPGRPGKGVRARLGRPAGPWPAGRPTARPAELPLVVEMLHAGSLIVDDIEDGSQRAARRPALHRPVRRCRWRSTPATGCTSAARALAPTAALPPRSSLAAAPRASPRTWCVATQRPGARPRTRCRRARRRRSCRAVVRCQHAAQDRQPDRAGGRLGGAVAAGADAGVRAGADRRFGRGSGVGAADARRLSGICAAPARRRAMRTCASAGRPGPGPGSRAMLGAAEYDAPRRLARARGPGDARSTALADACACAVAAVGRAASRSPALRARRGAELRGHRRRASGARRRSAGECARLEASYG